MLVDAKLMINGKELKTQIEIDEVDLEAMQNKKKTGYERVGDLKKYYWIGDDGLIHMSYNNNITSDDLRYDTANYYSSEEVARNNARADQLMRKLRRFAVENRKEKIDWNDGKKHKYNICYNYDSQEIHIDYETNCRGFEIYFDSQETAERAIKEFEDELIWYFTEYKDSL